MSPALGVFLRAVLALNFPSRRLFSTHMEGSYKCSGATNAALVHNLCEHRIVTDPDIKAALLSQVQSNAPHRRRSPPRRSWRRVSSPLMKPSAPSHLRRTGSTSAVSQRRPTRMRHSCSAGTSPSQRHTCSAPSPPPMRLPPHLHLPYRFLPCPAARLLDRPP